MLNQRALSSGRESGRMSEAIAAVDRAQSRVELANQKQVQVQVDGEMKSFTLTEIKREVESFVARLLKLDGELAEAEEADAEARDSLGASLAVIDQLGALLKSPAQCPAVGFEMKCPVRPTTFATAYEKSGGGADPTKDAKEKKEIHEADHRIAKTRLEEVIAERQAVESHSELWVMALTEATLQESERQAARSEWRDAKDRVATLESDEVEGDVPPNDDELEAAESRVALGQKVVNLRALLDQRKDQEVELRAERAKVDLEVSWWDEIEKLLRPDGIEAALAGMATSRFSEILKTCDALAEVRITDAMELSINGELITTRSKSEQLCGGIALQAAMCFQVGLPLLIVDELDKLDAHWKRTFQAWAATARESFAGGIVALATSDADPPGTPPDGFLTAWLRPGEPVLHLGGSFD
jgi:hypothetical protein